jgi:SAM-dependent methyltransferase
MTEGGTHGDHSVDGDRAAADDHRSRGASEVWRDAVREALAPAPTGPLLDVGSGTGLWSRLLGEWTGRTVLAVEPATVQRAIAVAGSHLGEGHGGGGHGEPPPTQVVILHLAGLAAALSLRDASAGGAWLSGVIHHVGDVGACARELRRVLAPGAPVVIRGAFKGRYRGIPVERYFPGARAALDTYPSVDEVVADFESAGFAQVRLDAVEDPPRTLAHWREALPRQRVSDTAMVGLSDDEFAAGLRAVDADIAAGVDPGPVRLDLLVLR